MFGLKKFIFFFFLLTTCSCHRKKEIYFYPNGTKKMEFIKKNNQSFKARSWYESGKKESRSRVIATDTVMVYEPSLKDSIGFPDIMMYRIDWFESGKVKEKEYPQKRRDTKSHSF